jgi:hypothetical protein
MKKLVCTVTAAALAFALIGAPNPAQATSYEDSLENCSYPKLFDLIVMRPLSLSMLGLGMALWVPLAPLTTMVSPGDLDDVTGTLIGEPTNFTFNRPLGACQGAQFFR